MKTRDKVVWVMIAMVAVIVLSILAIAYFPYQEYSDPLVGNPYWQPLCEEKAGDQIRYYYDSTSTDVFIYDYRGEIKCRYTIE